MLTQSSINPLKAIALAACLFLPSLAFASETFGSQGQWVPSGSAAYSYDKSLSPDSDSDYISGWSSSVVYMNPQVSYFVTDSFSLGLGITMGIESRSSRMDMAPDSLPSIGLRNHESTKVRLGINPSVGYNIAISDKWSFFPQTSLHLYRDSVSGKQWNDSQENETAIDVEPTYGADMSATGYVLYHPASNFFIGFGPVWHHMLASTRDDLVEQPEGYKNTTVTFSSTLGGWF